MGITAPPDFANRIALVLMSLGYMAYKKSDDATGLVLNEEALAVTDVINTAHDKMQKNYHYILTEPIGANFHPDFKPQLTPCDMLALGIFGGRYMRDCKEEFPIEWFIHAKLLPLGKKGHDEKLNFFKTNASQPLAVWRKKGWLHPDDPRGWFQWYCRYYIGRRHEDDSRQIGRFIAMKRHVTQIKNNCIPFDLECRKAQRQALLHWAYDSRNM